MVPDHNSQMPISSGLFFRVVDDTLIVEVDEGLYCLDVLFRTCYVFTDRAYLYLRRPGSGVVHVYISPKAEFTGSLQVLAGEFCNELLDYNVRALVSSETGKIRELIVAQAFSEANLLGDLAGSAEQDDDYQSDPLRIGYYRESHG